MRITKNRLRRTIRRVLKESLHGHMDGNLSNIILHACQLVDEEFGEITVHDVMITLQSLTDEEILSHADPMNYGQSEYGQYFVDTVRSVDYDMTVEKMYELVELGELSDGYEDFFSIAK